MWLHIAVLTVIVCSSLVVGNPDAKRLYDDLLSTYNRLIRPVANNSQKVTVKLGLRLSQLIEIVSILVFEHIIFYNFPGHMFIYVNFQLFTDINV